ncbi:hypothetical protein [Deinococcus apachensis]|uniref:hypothetical protein n=1 Tax=Deinococcus apachensis TaxID=309886 RepID=UPI000373938D|nr:hypothetical protein [Deinococcus apachensis]
MSEPDAKPITAEELGAGCQLGSRSVRTAEVSNRWLTRAGRLGRMEKKIVQIVIVNGNSWDDLEMDETMVSDLRRQFQTGHGTFQITLPNKNQVDIAMQHVTHIVVRNQRPPVML